LPSSGEKCGAKLEEKQRSLFDGRAKRNEQSIFALQSARWKSASGVKAGPWTQCDSQQKAAPVTAY
jgi:hypothetical protein